MPDLVVELSPEQQARMDLLLLRIVQNAGYMAGSLTKKNGRDAARAVGTVADSLGDVAGLLGDWTEHDLDFDRDRVVEAFGETAGAAATAVALFGSGYRPASRYPLPSYHLARQCLRELLHQLGEAILILEDAEVAGHEKIGARDRSVAVEDRTDTPPAP